ncbi:hypothetical protein K502DRAFT_324938 [Neoconidiobolus thromboides FSU 785]|nr:hypothetical protein K502DRAFT_324938 [Neoconidiobolus thromboides FSU 785]
MSEHNICYNLLKVPINHPTQLLPVFNVIRHQLRFNTLIQSCFNEKTYQPELDSFDYEIEKSKIDYYNNDIYTNIFNIGI